MNLLKTIIFSLGFFLLSCTADNNMNSNNTQNKDNKEITAYSFSARVVASTIKNQGRGAAKGKFAARIIDADIVDVFRGADIKQGQRVIIKMKSSEDVCKVGNVCTFNSPYKHPVHNKYVYFLEAFI